MEIWQENTDELRISDSPQINHVYPTDRKETSSLCWYVIFLAEFLPPPLKRHLFCVIDKSFLMGDAMHKNILVDNWQGKSERLSSGHPALGDAS